MKIGIATVHDSSNFGSFLQAFALQETLQKLGHDVYFLQTRSKSYVKKMYRVPRKLLLENPIHYIKESLYRSKKRRAFLTDQSCFKEISLDKADTMDLIILGSDEIWNVNVPVFTFPVFYGINMKSPVITYAVSAGNAKYKDFIARQTIIEAIKQLKCILVRDNNTAQICKALTGVLPEIVCDPTFLLDSHDFLHQRGKALKMSGEYIAVYAYEYAIGDQLRDTIVRFARENGLNIAAVGFYHKWADENILCGPLDFLNVLSGAKYVVTTTFHGTVFSILGHKKFITVPYSLKTRDILESLGLDGRIVSSNVSYSVFSDILSDAENINYNVVDEKISNWRKHSMSLLETSIEVHSVDKR